MIINEILEAAGYEIKWFESYMYQCRIVRNGRLVGYWSMLDIIEGRPPDNPCEIDPNEGHDILTFMKWFVLAKQLENSIVEAK